MGSRFLVYVKTGEQIAAGTDANVQIILHGNKGKTEPIQLDNFWNNDFEMGQTDTFSIPKAKTENIGDVVCRVEFWRDNSGILPGWYVDYIKVENMTTDTKYEFPVLRWVDSDYHYVINHLDTSLPQLDEYRDQREKDLDKKKKAYTYDQKGPGMPMQVKSLPPEEQFSFEYKFDMGKLKSKLWVVKNIVAWTSEKWESLKDLTNVTSRNIQSWMQSGADRWNNDIYFGHQRIAGLNHSLIKLCTHIPEKLAVDDEMLKPLLEGDTIEDAIRKNRLFICDLEIMKDLPHSSDLELCCPIGLFFINDNEKLVPIAIQLFQDPRPDNPVFLPTDPTHTWALAKMWYNNSDATYHQSLTHLGFTHLLMEGVAVATHRNLTQSHPLFKLLAPHFLYLIAINSRGLEMLVSEGGWVDKTMNTGIKGMFELIKRGLEQWRVDVQGTLPEDLRRRGLDDVRVLPGYHFRDDALLSYKAINTYVTKYVELYYDTPEKITGDWELQTWGAELTRPREDGGVGLLGVLGNGNFTSSDEVIMVLTTIIYTCSVSHAAANFPQYEEYAFPPNYPGLMRGTPPNDKSPKDESDILKALPDKFTTQEIMTITKILSRKGTKSLGDFEVQYILDPKARVIVDEFRRVLKEVSMIVKDRNDERDPPYLYLDPDIIPNAISI